MQKAKLTVNVLAEQKEKIQEIAKRKGLNMTTLVIMAINQIIEEEDAKKP